MGILNRVYTAANEAQVAAANWNTIQDRADMLWPMTADESTVPAGFLGGQWIYGEYSVSPGQTATIDGSLDYWAPEIRARDYRGRLVLGTAGYAGALAELPSGVDHEPTVIVDTAMRVFGTKTGGNTAGGKRWKPFAGADLYIYADDGTTGTAGLMQVHNTSGVWTYRVWVALFVSRSMVTDNIGDLRIWSFADRAGLKSSFVNELQDRLVMSLQASEEQGAIPATFMGSTWIYGEFTVAATTTKVIDVTRDWTNAMSNMWITQVAAADQLPTGVNHDPTTSPTQEDNLIWCLKTGYNPALGWPPAGGSYAWECTAPGDIYVFLDSVSKELKVRNNTVAEIYLYGLCQMYPAIA